MTKLSTRDADIDIGMMKYDEKKSREGQELDGEEGNKRRDERISVVLESCGRAWGESQTQPRHQRRRLSSLRLQRPTNRRRPRPWRLKEAQY
jgi:hypothetical protein